jgi:hypothetical protein
MTAAAITGSIDGAQALHIRHPPHVAAANYGWPAGVPHVPS